MPIDTTDTGRIKPVFENGRFFNPFPTKKVSAKGAFKARFNNKAITKPPQYLPSQQVDIAKALPKNETGLYVTWLGHSSLIVQIDGVRILIDPVFSNNISPVPVFSVRRFQKDAPVSSEELPFMDAVFISHNHYDHLDRRTIDELKYKVGFFIAPTGIGRILQEWGISPDKIREFTWWQEGILQGLSGKSIKFACAPAQHFSLRSPFDRNKTLWASWVFISPAHKVFYSGDTSYEAHFKQISHHYGPFDLNLMENGQYSIYWPSSHMMPEDGVKAHMDLKGKYMIPVHWGSFNLSIHDWWEPIERVSKEAAEKGVSLLTPRVGQTLAIDENPATSAWWRD